MNCEDDGLGRVVGRIGFIIIIIITNYDYYVIIIYAREINITTGHIHNINERQQ